MYCDIFYDYDQHNHWFNAKFNNNNNIIIINLVYEKVAFPPTVCYVLFILLMTIYK